MTRYPVRRCFISHAWTKGQHDFARLLHRRLIRYKGIACWLDEEKIVPGVHIYDRVAEALNCETDLALCVLSPEYLQSGNCKAELSRAARLAGEGNHPIIPVVLAPCEMLLELEGRLYVDFRRAVLDTGQVLKEPFNTALALLVRGIRHTAPFHSLPEDSKRMVGTWEGSWTHKGKPRRALLKIFASPDEAGGLGATITVSYERNGASSVVEQECRVTVEGDALQLSAYGYRFIERGTARGWILDTFRLQLSADGTQLVGQKTDTKGRSSLHVSLMRSESAASLPGPMISPGATPSPASVLC